MYLSLFMASKNSSPRRSVGGLSDFPLIQVSVRTGSPIFDQLLGCYTIDHNQSTALLLACKIIFNCQVGAFLDIVF